MSTTLDRKTERKVAEHKKTPAEILAELDRKTEGHLNRCPWPLEQKRPMENNAKTDVKTVSRRVESLPPIPGLIPGVIENDESGPVSRSKAADGANRVESLPPIDLIAPNSLPSLSSRNRLLHQHRPGAVVSGDKKNGGKKGPLVLRSGLRISATLFRGVAPILSASLNSGSVLDSSSSAASSNSAAATTNAAPAAHFLPSLHP
ncbi:MAG: hypothetical protein M1561_04325 [Gammaproteobacteria bacterium]|nr:hypothetical protein [Gammaproteobacteria bacterium]